jgi:hypothetical protein
MLMIWWCMYCIWHTECLMWLVDWFKLLAHRLMFSFLLWASASEVMLFTRKHERPPILLRILCATLDDMFQIFGYILRCWVAMELPCEICTAKMLPKGKLVGIGGRCFLESASILFDAAV